MSTLHKQRGQTLPLIAMAALVLVGAAGFAADAGYHQYRQRIQQTATDSAAIAAGQELLAGNFAAAARLDAASNGFTGGVTVSNPPVAPDAFAGRADAVEVLISTTNPTFFERIFGIAGVQIVTKAVALLVTEPSNQCVVTLNGNANFNGGGSGATLNAPNCGLVFNGGANFNNATVNAAAIECAATCSNGTFTQAQPRQTAPESDPCPSIASCAYMENHPPPCTSQPAIPSAKGGSVTLVPGCYGSGNLKNLNNTNVTFSCGLYVIDGTLDISATGNKPPVTIDQSCSPPGGVTLYVGTGGQISFKNANINLSAPSSGDYSAYAAGEQGALIYQAAGNTNTVLLQSASCSGCASQLSGMLYAPSANLNYNASNNTSSGSGVLIVAGSANFNGSLSNVFGAPGNGNLQTRVAVLGE